MKYATQQNVRMKKSSLKTSLCSAVLALPNDSALIMIRRRRTRNPKHSGSVLNQAPERRKLELTWRMENTTAVMTSSPYIGLRIGQSVDPVQRSDVDTKCRASIPGSSSQSKSMGAPSESFRLSLLCKVLGPGYPWVLIISISNFVG